jgi:hypothetical protein
VIKLLIQLREEDMNTIQITTVQPESNDRITVNYTEAEVIRFIEKAKEADAIQQRADKHNQEIRNIRNEVRDFFSEGEWSDGETTVNKGDVNALLERIGANKLTTKYTANYTITGTFNVEVEDERDVESLFVDNVTVEFYDGDVDVDLIEVNDIEEEYR